MNTLLSAIARTFLRTFAGALIIFAPGVLAAPDVGAARGLGVAALLASIAAGIRSVQAYVPQLTLTHYIGASYGVYADSFLHGFLASLVATVPGVLTTPELNGWRSIAVSVLTGAATAGFRSVQGLLTKGESPAPGTGLPDPPAAPAVAPTANAIASSGPAAGGGTTADPPAGH